MMIRRMFQTVPKHLSIIYYILLFFGVKYLYYNEIVHPRRDAKRIAIIPTRHDHGPRKL